MCDAASSFQFCAFWHFGDPDRMWVPSAHFCTSVLFYKTGVQGWQALRIDPGIITMVPVGLFKMIAWSCIHDSLRTGCISGNPLIVFPICIIICSFAFALFCVPPWLCGPWLCLEIQDQAFVVVNGVHWLWQLRPARVMRYCISWVVSWGVSRAP